MLIDGREIRESDNRVYFIAEVGLCHNGSPETAKRLIDVAVEAGADAVKFQKRTVGYLATAEVLDRSDDRFPRFGSTYREIREYLEFDEEVYKEIFAYCAERSITCFVTPFDIAAVDFLENFDVPAYKIASHSVTDLPFIESVAQRKRPVIISSGMVELEELDEAVQILDRRGVDYAILHCVSSYPTAIAEANIRMIDTLKQRYGVIIGFSGHETDNLITLAAVARGAKIVERHITLDHSMEGFDHKVALDPAELVHYLKEIRKIEVILGDGVKAISDKEMETRKKYRRSVASKTDISEGEVITEEKLTTLNPGTGIPPREIKNIVGMRTKTDIKRGVLLERWMFRGGR